MSTTQEICIRKPRGLLSRCIPNLMPFHIAYSGPAPISTFFRVKPVAKPTFGLSEPDSASNALESTDTQDTQTASSSQATLVASSSASSLSSATQASAQLAAVAPDGAGIEDAEEESSHFEAAFRGRTVRGMKVNLPAGYSGLVLRTPDDARENDAAAQRQRAREKEREKKAKAAKRKTRGAARAVAVESGEDEEMHRENGGIAEDVEEAPRRVLEPISTFSSFVIWNPDIPVDEGQDEYLRALTEWTSLAAEIHRCDD